MTKNGPLRQAWHWPTPPLTDRRYRARRVRRAGRRGSTPFSMPPP